MAGYSEKSLKDKLGIKDEADLLVANPPQSYAQLVGGLDSNSISSDRSKKYSFIHAFFQNKLDFEKEYFELKNCLEKDGMLWISWPKKSSGIFSDLNENIIREFTLENGLVDVKVCAVDDDWSGLKLVYRLKDR